MTKEHLLYKLTGTETQKNITTREGVLIDKCLSLINDLEQRLFAAENNQHQQPIVFNRQLNEYEINSHSHWKENTDPDPNGSTIKHFQS